MELTVGSLFSGIGGIDLGLERAGMCVRWQCEIDPYCREVLAKHWPGLTCYSDIRDIGGEAERVDVVAGGFPCQPVSDAGRRKAQADPRWLWPEFERVVGVLRPRFVFVENVPGLAGRGLSGVIGSLTSLGYDAEWDVVSASSVGAPHLRERLFVVAYAEGVGLEERGVSGVRERGGVSDAAGGGRRGVDTGEQEDSRGERNVADADGFGRDWRPRYFTEKAGRREPQDSGWWSVEPAVGRVAHGVPNRVAQLRALGNAVVPQVAEFVGRLIVEREEGAACADAG